MQRVTITIDDPLLEVLDGIIEHRGYASRSEAMRNMIRNTATQQAAATDRGSCVAVLAFVYDHETRSLAQRLVQSSHDHHDLIVAGMHVHLDHDSCLEVSVLKGDAAAVGILSDELTAQRGVRHANLHLVPVKISKERHSHRPKTTSHDHVHA